MAAVRRRAGFTLLELLLVLGVLAVLVGVTAVLLPSLTPETADAAAGQIAAVSDRARAEAMQTGRRVRLTLDSDAGTATLSWEEEPAERPGEFSDLPDNGSRPVRLPSGARFGQLDVAGVRLDSPAVAGGSAVIDFFPDGSSDAAVIEVTAGEDAVEQQRWVVVSASAAPATIATVRPDLAPLPRDQLSDAGEANREGLPLDSLFNFRGGLGGNNPYDSGSPDLKTNAVSGNEPPETPPEHGLLPTVPQ